MRIAVKIAYDGHPFIGYARQPDLRTVEGEILNCLKTTRIIKNVTIANFRSASRTDKGVSSFGNVFSCNTDVQIEQVLSLLSQNLEEIVPYAISVVDDSFYPRHAKTRWYRYYLHDHNYSMDTLISICKIFHGTHDFSNFSRVEAHKNPQRTLDRIQVSKEDDFIYVDFYAQTFLWHQIRRIMSAILKVIDQKITIEDINQALANPNKQYDFGIAFSEPLVLMEVFYSDILFQANPILKKEKEKLEQRLIDRFRDLSV